MRPQPLPPLYGDLCTWALIQAESIEFMKRFPDACVDAIVTDPPYWLGFAGKSWDGAGGSDYPSTPEGFQAFTKDWASEAKRILKPGAHLVACGAARTVHRLTVGIEASGFEIRDSLIWLYTSGMPKSRRMPGGLGTALKPSYEPLVLARKPLSRRLDGKPGTVADNISRFGTGALNISETRVRADQETVESYWPSNVMLSHHEECTTGECVAECPAALIDRQSDDPSRPISRIFHTSKASQAEREAGLARLEAKVSPIFSASKYRPKARVNLHPTVKPLALMEWVIRLTTPANGLVVDPFTGSGSTGCAAMLAGRQFVGIEREPEYVEIARARLAHWSKEAIQRAS